MVLIRRKVSASVVPTPVVMPPSSVKTDVAFQAIYQKYYGTKKSKRKEVNQKMEKAIVGQKAVAPTKVTVTSVWIKTLVEASGKNTDKSIAMLMGKNADTAKLSHKAYTELDVRKVRSLYNKGKLAGQTSIPTTKLAEYIGPVKK